MDKWETVVQSFIEKWKSKENIEGFLVCGSYVTGLPSQRSDIDLHIILSPEIDWRQRGSEIVDGFLIEYFVNPPSQIETYFADDYKANRKHAAHMFVTGKILIDKNGIVANLKTSAENWLMKDFPELDKITVELNKYTLWDLLDNLQDLYESGSNSFTYTYWSSLKTAFEFYSRYLRHDVIPIHKMDEQLNNDSIQAKYLVQEYPDERFKDMMNDALNAQDIKQMKKCFKEIVEYVHERTGGFTLDRWNIRTPLTF